MDILVVGNGFDLSLGLPTKYKHFLVFLAYLKSKGLIMCESTRITSYDSLILEINPEVAKIIEDLSNNTNLFLEKKDELNLATKNNFWMEYFYKKLARSNERISDRWVDFETEISFVIDKIEKYICSKEANISDRYFPGNITEIDTFINSYGLSYTYQSLHDKLLKDLEKTIWLLNFYIYHVIEKMDIKIPEYLKRALYPLEKSAIVKVITFNYTTKIELFLKRYKINYDIDYIHGKTKDYKLTDIIPIIIGAEKGSDSELFADFKKYFQRIVKKTNHNYMNWISEMKRESEKHMHSYQDMAEYFAKEEFSFESMSQAGLNKVRVGYPIIHNIYFYGHSIDITDGDIINQLLSINNAYTNIYCYAESEEDHKDMVYKVKNMQKVIGREELIKRTNSSKKEMIEFINVVDI